MKDVFKRIFSKEMKDYLKFIKIGAFSYLLTITFKYKYFLKTTTKINK